MLTLVKNTYVISGIGNVYAMANLRLSVISSWYMANWSGTLPLELISILLEETTLTAMCYVLLHFLNCASSCIIQITCIHKTAILFQLRCHARPAVLQG